MAKFRKKIIFVVILALCLALSLTLVACNGDNDKPPTTANYSVTVKIGDTPQANVKVTISNASVEVEEVTGEDGKVTFELTKGTYTVTIDTATLPAHYLVPANATLTLTEDNTDTVIELEREAEYVVKLVNPDGTAFVHENVNVQICTFSGNCIAPVALGENGSATIYAAKGDYHVTLSGTGFANYAYENDVDGYYIGKNFSATETEMTITVYPVLPLDLTGTPMTTEEKEPYGIDSTTTAYKFAKTFAAGETTIFSISLNAGQYGIYKNPGEGGDDVKVLYSEVVFKKGAAAVLPDELTPAKQTKYYIQVINGSENATDAEFVITVPSTSYITVDEGAVNLSNQLVAVSNSTTYATIKFQPEKPGKYTITAKGDDATFIGYHISTVRYYLDTEVMTDLPEKDYVENNSVSFKVTEDQTLCIFIGVAIQSDIYPASATIDIKLDKEIHNNTAAAEVQETLVPQTIPSGKEIAKLPMTEEVLNALTYNDTDKCYYYGESKVYVVLTEPIILLGEEDDSLAYLDKTTRENEYLYDVTTPADKADLTKGNSYVDYRLFLRGFTAYEEKPGSFGRIDYVIPDELEVENCYANNVNKDGAYPLTKELETFVKAFYANHPYDPEEWINLIDASEADEGCEWMFALYYYVNETPADVIVGEYSFYSHKGDGKTIQLGGTKRVWDADAEDYVEVPVVGNEWKLVVYKNGTFKMFVPDPDAEGVWQEESDGSWTKDENGVYTFADSAPVYWGGHAYSVEFNETTGYLKLHEPDYQGDSNYDYDWEFNKIVANND